MKTRLLGKLAYRCKLVRPLPVIILHFTDGQYAVRDGITDNYGLALTKGEALAEYRRMLAADFIELAKEEYCLSDHLQQELNNMRQFVRRY